MVRPLALILGLGLLGTPLPGLAAALIALGKPTQGRLLEARIEGVPADDVKPAAKKAHGAQYQRMLFDLKNDPGETINLANRDGYAAIEQELRARCLARSPRSALA